MAYRSQVTITRPADTTAYTAGDVVGGVIDLPGLGDRVVNSLLITDANLRLDISAIPSGMTSFRLHLYTATPPSAYADNAAWDLPSGDRSIYAGFIDLGSPADVGSTCFAQVTQVNMQIHPGSGTTALYGYLVTNGAYTPAANSETYALTLRAIGL